jgi:hypothetical protein
MASLETIYRKLRRAEKDLDALEGELRAFDQSNAYVIITELDPANGDRIYRIRIFREPDPEWEITVGEIAYQMRSSLDHLVTQLVVLNGGDAEKHRGSFPIFVNAEDYWKKLKRGGTRRDQLLEGVAGEHRAVIDSLQPYQRGPRQASLDPLAVLNELCNGDKHRDSHPALLAMRSASLEFGPNETGAVLFTERSPNPTERRRKPLKDGAEVYRITPITMPDGTVRPPVEVSGGVMRVGVCFGTAQVFIFDLRRILAYVETQVVGRFAPAVA